LSNMKLILVATLMAVAIPGIAFAQPTSALSKGSPVIYNESRPLVIGVLLFDGFEPLDVFGPIEIFGALEKNARIVTISEKKGPSAPRFGPTVNVDFTLDKVPALDVFLIPGGIGTRSEVNNTALVGAIKRIAEATPHVVTVCTGSALLARTGLLRDCRATSNKRAFQWVTEQDKTVKWVHKARWVEDGKYFTSSGVSAGIDVALGVVKKIFGRDAAVKIAERVEYIWNEDAGNDPFAALNPLPK